MTELDIKMIALSSIVVDADRFQVRESMSDDAVQAYAELARTGTPLPPLRIVRISGVLYLAEGFHRYLAYKQIGATAARCLVVDGTEADALAVAIDGNSVHGVRMTRSDKRRACLMYLSACEREGREVSQHELAKMLGVGQSTVSRWQADARGVQAETPEITVVSDVVVPGAAAVEIEHPPVPDIPLPADARVQATVQMVTRINASSHGHALLVQNIGKLLTAIRKQAEDLLSVELKRRLDRAARLCGELQDLLRQTAPDEMCPGCNGAGCKTCADRGWLSAEQATAWHREHDIKN